MTRTCPGGFGWINSSAIFAPNGPRRSACRLKKTICFRSEGNPQGLSRLQHDQDMPRRLRVDKLVRDFRPERPKKIRMPLKKANMLLVRGRDQCIDLDCKGAPVTKKKFNHRHRKPSLTQLFHEGGLRHPLFPPAENFPIKLIDKRLRLCRAHRHATLRN